MSRKIDFYFDFISPFSYLAITQLPQSQKIWLLAGIQRHGYSHGQISGRELWSVKPEG